jgi:hypothetical protein
MPSGAVHPNSILGRWLLDRPVKPGDDNTDPVNLIGKMG